MKQKINLILDCIIKIEIIPNVTQGTVGYNTLDHTKHFQEQLKGNWFARNNFISSTHDKSAIRESQLFKKLFHC